VTNRLTLARWWKAFNLVRSPGNNLPSPGREAIPAMRYVFALVSGGSCQAAAEVVCRRVEFEEGSGLEGSPEG
jgi:hypothetical protein